MIQTGSPTENEKSQKASQVVTFAPAGGEEEEEGEVLSRLERKRKVLLCQCTQIIQTGVPEVVGWDAACRLHTRRDGYVL